MLAKLWVSFSDFGGTRWAHDYSQGYNSSELKVSAISRFCTAVNSTVYTGSSLLVCAANADANNSSAAVVHHRVPSVLSPCLMLADKVISDTHAL